MRHLAGQTLGHYQVGAAIMEGNATIFRATDTRTGAEVALKVLPFAGQAGLFKELEILQGWHHPHLNPLLDFGTAEGHAFLVMPWLHGGNLWHKLNKSLSVKIFAQQMAGALNALHESGGVHGRLSYTNILFDEAENAFLSDAAMRVVWAFGGQPVLVRPHTLIAPEVIKGELPSAASDQYSLAILIYELLAGHNPFDEAVNMAQVVLSVLNQPVPPLADSALNAVLQRALAKNPAERFPNVMAFAAALS